MVRKQEEYCKDVFDVWLREGVIEPKWEKVSQTEEPPDYFLYVRGRTVAVEITSLFFPESFQNGTPVTQPAISAMISASFKKLAARLNQKGVLQGVYSVQIEGPFELYSRHEYQVVSGFHCTAV